MVSSALRRLFTACCFVFGSGAKSWTIDRTSSNRFFNVVGNAEKDLAAGVDVNVKGAQLKVELSQFFEDASYEGGGYTYVQLDGKHSGKAGDTVSLATAVQNSEPPPPQAPAPRPKSSDFGDGYDFSPAVDVNDVKKEVRSQGKPAVVIVTQPWCGACTGLKSSLSDSNKVKALMKKFVAVHAVGDQGNQWQFPGEDDGYIPRVYFLDTSGEMMDIAGPNAQYKHFIPSADAFEKAMKTALEKSAPKDEL